MVRYPVKESLSLLFAQIFRQKTPPASRLNGAYLLKELYGTCAMAHRREAPTATTVTVDLVQLPVFEPGTLYFNTRLTGLGN